MKICSKCGAQCPDEAAFCTTCGTPLNAQTAPNGQPAPNVQQVWHDPTDHTAEFDPKDISENKVIAMLVYLMGWIGILIALLAANSSPYAAFHVRQALKIEVLSTLTLLISVLLFFTFIVPIAGAVCAVILFVVKIICFFSICSGNAKEPPIVKSFTFLK